MKQITEQEFNQHKIARQKTLIEHMIGRKPTEEKAWFEHEGKLGIVLFDTIDNDWSFVALHKHKDGFYRAEDLGVSFPKQDYAIGALWYVLHGKGSF